MSTQPKWLYHYTNAQGLMGIIRSGEIWATHAEYTNDASEIVHGRKLVDKLAERVAKSVEADRRSSPTRPTRDVNEAVLRQVPNLFRLADVYVTSFSETGDLLSQWRAYGGNDGGFALGFEMESLESALILGNQSEALVGLERAIYEPKRQESLVVETLTKKVIVPIDANTSEGAHSDEGEDTDRRGAIIRAAFDIGTMLPRFKHRRFSEEREWRAIAINPHGASISKIKFRAENGLIIPYLPLSIAAEENREPFGRIIIGPSPHQEQSQRAVKMLLGHAGYHAVKIKMSRIPVRLR